MTTENIERIATALERIADAQERAHPKFNPGGYVGGDYAIPEMPLRGGERVVTSDEIRRATECDDRTCTTRSHWAPFGRVNHGDAPTTCIYGQDHSDAVGCVYRCAATMPGHRCTRAEHADDRHQWTMTDEEYDRRREEAGVPRDVFDDVRAWADGREAAQRRLTAGCGDRGGECGQLDGSGAAGLNLNVQTGMTVRIIGADGRDEPDPLDEDDHRPRHFMDGGGDVIGTHLYRHGDRHWHSYPVEYPPCNQGCRLALTNWADIPLTFCDCNPTDSDRATD